MAKPVNLLTWKRKIIACLNTTQRTRDTKRPVEQKIIMPRCKPLFSLFNVSLYTLSLETICTPPVKMEPVDICTYMCVFIYMYKYLFVCIHAYIYIHTQNTHTYICIYMPRHRPYIVFQYSFSVLSLETQTFIYIHMK